MKKGTLNTIITVGILALVIFSSGCANTQQFGVALANTGQAITGGGGGGYNVYAHERRVRDYNATIQRQEVQRSVMRVEQLNRINMLSNTH